MGEHASLAIQPRLQRHPDEFRERLVVRFLGRHVGRVRRLDVAFGVVGLLGKGGCRRRIAGERAEDLLAQRLEFLFRRVQRAAGFSLSRYAFRMAWYAASRALIGMVPPSSRRSPPRLSCRRSTRLPQGEAGRQIGSSGGHLLCPESDSPFCPVTPARRRRFVPGALHSPASLRPAPHRRAKARSGHVPGGPFLACSFDLHATRPALRL